MNNHSEMTVFHSDRTGRFADWRLALKSILGFWFVYALTVVARALLGTDPGTVLRNKLFVIAIGMVITGLVYVAIANFGRGSTIGRKAIVAGIASMLSTIARA